MGADYLGFTIHPDHPQFVSPPVLKEIIEWVEGPETVLEVPEIVDELWLANYRAFLDDFYLESDRTDLYPDFQILTSVDQKIKDNESFVVFQSAVSFKDQKSTISSLCNLYKNRLFLDIPFEVTELDELLSHNPYGLILRGGDEEKVGFKSFDDLDEIFDKLMP
jgi:phosphoribosylanthranilate isomerase